MSIEVQAIYENGLFRPLGDVPLGEHVKVSLTVRPSRESPSCATPDNDFDSQLEKLLFDGPSLPADFSRADIYADHD